MKRILFVDDEAKILDGLRRSLRNMRGQWEMVFAEGGAAALQECACSTIRRGGIRRPHAGHGGGRISGQSEGSLPRHRANHPFRPMQPKLGAQVCREWRISSLASHASPRHSRRQYKGSAGFAMLFHVGPTREAISCVQWLPSQAQVYQELADQIESSTASIERVAGSRCPRHRDVGKGGAIGKFWFFWHPPTDIERGTRGQTSRVRDPQGDVGVRFGISAVFHGPSRRGYSLADDS